MKSESKRDTPKGRQNVDPHLRRSSRERREPKHDDYFMGSQSLEDLLGPAALEEDCYPKRRRKNHRYDDSDDYSDCPRPNRKHKSESINKVEALLEWRHRTEMLPVTLDACEEMPLDQLHQLHLTRSIPAENLQLLGQDLQAIFINIEWGRKGQTMRDFKQVKLQSSRLMSKGLVFVWAPKEGISELLGIMQQKGFSYVENFEVINFDIEKAKAYSSILNKRSSQSEEKREDSTQNEEVDLNTLIKSLDNADPCELIASEQSQYFNASKRTLLMFKKNSPARFELRHQRTCDVVFDMPLRLGEKCGVQLKAYIYNMIETLLPECLELGVDKKGVVLRMMELWGDREVCRRGWINVVQQ